MREGIWYKSLTLPIPWNLILQKQSDLQNWFDFSVQMPVEFLHWPGKARLNENIILGVCCSPLEFPIVSPFNFFWIMNFISTLSPNWYPWEYSCHGFSLLKAVKILIISSIFLYSYIFNNNIILKWIWKLKIGPKFLNSIEKSFNKTIEKCVTVI